LPSATNCISPVNTCYTFRSYWLSSGIKYTIFKTQNKMHTHWVCEISQTDQKNVVDGSMYISL